MFSSLNIQKGKANQWIGVYNAHSWKKRKTHKGSIIPKWSEIKILFSRKIKALYSWHDPALCGQIVKKSTGTEQQTERPDREGKGKGLSES